MPTTVGDATPTTAGDATPATAADAAIITPGTPGDDARSATAAFYTAPRLGRPQRFAIQRRSSA
jgi:hypothetical protein